ncbi:MAG: ATP-binding protein [Lachnospiraceae bacterium]
MVNLLIGPKGCGKTQQMMDLANKSVKEYDGNVVFIKKSHKETSNLTHDIRVICMADYEAITNIDEYIGFIYGMISCNHDIQVVFIDGILKHANISSENLPKFIERLKLISKEDTVEFFVSCSVEKTELSHLDMTDCSILN